MRLSDAAPRHGGSVQAVEGPPIQPAIQYPLRWLLSCASCDVPLGTILLADGRRGYCSPCGCRTCPIDALVLERLVSRALARRGLLPDDGVVSGDVFARMLAQICIGAVADDITLILRV